jgi:hypothetical protein
VKPLALRFLTLDNADRLAQRDLDWLTRHRISRPEWLLSQPESLHTAYGVYEAVVTNGFVPPDDLETYPDTHDSDARLRSIQWKTSR